MALLHQYLHQTVSVITNDGRVLVGVLKAFDQVTNVVLDECHERVYSLDAGVTTLPLGVYILRGDNVAMIGAIDEELDASLDLSQIRAAPLPPIVHTLM
ncbi:small nuclear ribonucleoprotein splicing factor [Thecamonas trahens ATCC 50062]|uniref:U6 snRNA-associated Sm-like protein LSm8 n=1 Tax=Thecamonas trahens ATCC 50062 TaxID=461836 RepID=A0A0L0D886_THETB|nr:small nuclear ribonucleoprotein splicing factor [Thecamonas trahens ATCC 50062]KNC48286.1 small nuclear ribonucleoprotein splicing factor [Thecamonas trahens ATCC 50062]|eukprot:XP_013758853.1 small nuclear ribonucleoprotein splicing factor [Thecamonas trahens ATCC 50062]